LQSNVQPLIPKIARLPPRQQIEIGVWQVVRPMVEMRRNKEIN